MRLALLLVAVFCLAASAAHADIDQVMFNIWGTTNNLSIYRYVDQYDAGMNVSNPTIWSVQPNMNIILNACQQYGMKVIVADPRIMALQQDNPNFYTSLDGVIADFSTHPATYGYFLTDEPLPTLFPQIGAVSKYLSAKDPSHTTFTNLWGSYIGAPPGTSSYDDYINQFMAAVNPPLLSYDDYTAMQTYSGGCFFTSLEFARTTTLTRNIPFNNIILLAGDSLYRDPSYADLRWQVYNSLAYGAHGIMYFGYQAGPIVPDSALVMYITGARSHHFPQLQQIHSDVKNLSPTLSRLHSDAVYHNISVPTKGVPLPVTELVSTVTGGGAVIGMFSDGTGKRYVMLVNKDMQNDHDLTFTFFQIPRRVYEISKSTGQPVLVGTNQAFTMHFLAGEGRLFAIDTPEWTFDTNGNLDGWYVGNSVGNFAASNGNLVGDITGSDPYIFGPRYPDINADIYHYIDIRMKSTGDNMAYLEFGTAAEPWDRAERSLGFSVIPDGQFHDYIVDMKAHPQWTGWTNSLRLDPANLATSGHFEIDYIKVLPDTTPPTGSININNTAPSTVSTAVTLYPAASDTESGVTKMRFSNDNSSWTVWENYAGSKAWSIQPVNGLRTVYAQFKDGVGNISQGCGASINLLSDAWDVSRNWSDNANPGNGWSYMNSSKQLLSSRAAQWLGHSNPDFLIADQPGWQLGTTSVPGFCRSVGGCVHDFPVGRAGGHTPWAVQWTAPYDTWVDLSGGVWMFRDIGRTCQFGLYRAHSGVTTPIFENVLIPGRSQGYNSAHTYTLAQAMTSKGLDPSALTGIRVYAGDTVWVTAAAATSEDFVGLDFTITKTQDVTPPSGSITLNGGLAYTNDMSLTLTLLSTDDMSGTTQMRFGSDDLNWGDWIAYSTSSVWFPTPDEGLKTVYAQFKDAAGNASGSFSDTIIVDRTAPLGSVSINGGAAYITSPNVTLTLSATDPTGGVKYMKISNDSTDMGSYLTYASTYPWNLTSGEGIKTLYVAFRDGARNTSDTFSASIALGTPVSIAEAKTRIPGSFAIISGVVVTAKFSDCLYVEDATRCVGIKVVGSPGVSEKDKVDLAGTMLVSGGEKALQAATWKATGTDTVKPLGMRTAFIGGGDSGYSSSSNAGQQGVLGASGLNNLGLLVETWGSFGYLAPTTFTINDGQGPINCVVDPISSIALDSNWHYAIITGISSCTSDGDHLHPLVRVTRVVPLN